MTELVQSNIQGQSFTFHFDETTNSQVKKQYDGYATYCSPEHKQISSAYCGSLYVGKCSADDMLVHFHEFMKKAGLNPAFMLALGMDGPNVNLLFKSKLKEEFPIIEVGTCPLHIVNNGFGKAVEALKESIVDLDEVAIDFHSFYKYSAARREQYTVCHEITGVTAKMMEKHCSTRWLSLEKVLVKLMEQWENLSEYLRKVPTLPGFTGSKVPTLPGFTGSKGISSTGRYVRIKGYLQSKKIPVVIVFVVSFAQDFRKFIKTFETNAPLIHLLYQKCLQLLHTVFDKFLTAEVIQEKKSDQGYAMKHIKNLKQIYVKLQSKHKTSYSFGSQTDLQLRKSKLNELEKKRLKRNMEEATTESAGYLLDNFPIGEQVVRDAQYLGHQNNDVGKGAVAIKSLCYNVCRTRN